jgi:hypothetical protein
MSKTDLIIGVAGLLLECGLAALLLWRRAYREFPFFLGYLLCSILINTVRISLVGGDYLMFFKVYWAGEALYVIAALLALHEAFRWVFLEFYELRWFWLLFPGVVVLISTFAVVHALRNPPAQAPQIIGVILSFGSAVSYLKAGLFGLFFLLVLLFGLRWRSYPFGIVLGFAASAFGSWFAYGVRSEFGTKFNFLSKYAVPVAYLCGVALWLATFARPPDPEPTHGWLAVKTPQELLEEVRQYVKVLRGSGKNDRHS